MPSSLPMAGKLTPISVMSNPSKKKARHRTVSKTHSRVGQRSVESGLVDDDGELSVASDMRLLSQDCHWTSDMLMVSNGYMLWARFTGGDDRIRISRRCGQS